MRLLELLWAYAAMLIDENIDSTLPSNRKNFLLTPLFILYCILADLYLEGKEKHKFFAGQLGSNPLALFQALKKGNLRERLLILLTVKKTIFKKLKKLPDKGCSAIAKINAKLIEQRCSWQLPDTLAILNEDNDYSILSDTIPLRIHRPTSDPKIVQLQRKIPLISQAQDLTHMRIPLSPREMRFALNQSTAKGEISSHLFWLSGEIAFIPKKHDDLPTDPYLQAVHHSKMDVVGGISGTANGIMSMLVFMRLDAKDELYQGRLATLLWMLDPRSHSVCEVLTACKAFDLPFTFGPSYYRELLPPEASYRVEFFNH